MAIAGLNLGIDLGSANTAVCLPGQGVALREASYVLTLEQNENEVLAIGDDAKALLGRTDEEAALIAPILDGAVADIDLAAMLASALAEKALSRRRWKRRGPPRPFRRARPRWNAPRCCVPWRSRARGARWW